MTWPAAGRSGWSGDCLQSGIPRSRRCGLGGDSEGLGERSPETCSGCRHTVDRREAVRRRAMPFQARKGETYKLAAATKLRNFEELCIVVARPDGDLLLRYRVFYPSPSLRRQNVCTIRPTAPQVTARQSIYPRAAPLNIER